ncbi:MAG: terminase gpA endonuclease subunit [Desulfovermiculus sp.]|nr:terminase gpA endonuclease subunit [Desulfovermiculus sp.]
MHSADCQTALNKWWSSSWSPPALLNPWQWAEAELEFSARSTPFPGRFRSSLTPYVREPLEAFADPTVRRITLCWSAQSAKTTVLLVALAYVVAQDPGPALVVQSSESAAKSFSKNRLQPLIQDCDALSRHMTGKKHDFGILEMLLNRMTIYLQGAGSPAQLAMRPVRYLFADEIDKWVDDSDKEADALSLALERTKSYRNSKQVLASTPTWEAGPIWQSYLAGTMEQFHLPCPKCGSSFTLEWAQLKWPETTSKTRIKAETYLECPNCKAQLTEKDRAAMLQSGDWIVNNLEATREHRSFHLNEIYSPLTKWGDLALKFLQAQAEAKTGNLGPLHNFINSSLAEPWQEDDHQQTRPPDLILNLADDRQPGQVPAQGVLALTAGVDTQDNGFWFIIRAWGQDLESWLIREGFAPDLDTLSNVVFGSFQDQAGNEHIVSQCLIDSQGHRTEEVYTFCRNNPKTRPLKGEQRLYGQPWKVSVQDKVQGRDGKQYPIPGGLQLFRIDTNHYKDLLAGKLNIPPGEPGSFRLHEGVSGDYIAHMTAEYRDEKGLWRQPKHKRCDLWDCEVYALAAADILGVRFWKAPGERKQAKPKPQPRRNPYLGGQTPGERVNRERPSWFNRRRG